MSTTTKIAWASPFSAASDVSAFTRNLLPHLRQPHQGREYEVFLLVNDNGRRYPTDLPTFSLNGGPEISCISSVFDHCILNIGNNRENHGHIFEFLKRVPSIVVFHDYVYQHVLAWECFENRKSRELYGYLMCDLYGAEALKVLESSRICSPRESNRIYAPWDGAVSTSFPMAPLFTRMASAVIVHSEFSERLVKSFFDGPVLRLQLPSDQKRSLSDVEIAQWQTATQARHTLNAVSFGHISRQKCLHLTLEAMAESHTLRERMRYTIAGHPGDKRYVEELQQLTQFYGLSNNVRFEFAVTDERLLQIKRDADFFVNVRFPNTEGASGSLVEQMNTGKPVVVGNTGCYADMPEGTVLKIADHASAAQLCHALERLILEPKTRVAIGSAGVTHIRQIDGASYALQLKEFLVDNADILERRRRQLQVNAVAKRPLGQPDDPDASWRESLVATRGAWMAFDHDQHIWSPRPFMEWEPDVASRFAASILLDEYGNDNLVLEIAAQLKVDRIAFYERFTELRALHRFAIRPEVEENFEAIRLQRIFSVPFWRLAVLLRPSVFVRICFLALYARRWDLLEAGLWEKQLERASEPMDVIREFLQSREFLDLAMHEVDYQSLLEWTEQEDLTAAAAKLPPYRLGSALDFSLAAPENQAYLKGLWYKPEVGGTWSQGSRGTVVIPFENHVSGDVEIELKLRTVGTAVAGPVALRIWLKDQIIMSATLPDDHLATLQTRIPKELVSGDAAIKIGFQTSIEIVPEALGISPDKRRLGLLLKSMSLRSASSALKNEENETR